MRREFAPDLVPDSSIQELPARLAQVNGLMLEAKSDNHVVIVDTVTGRRVRASVALYRLLSRFTVPSTIDEACGCVPSAGVLRGVRVLLDRGLLVEADKAHTSEAARRRASPFRFCHAPAAIDNQTCDIMVMGVPYDLGGDGNHRDAPTLVRMKSLDYVYLVDFDTCKPLGWHDASADRRILAGVSLCDAGDVCVHYGEGQAALMDRIEMVLSERLHPQTLPVLLGGDATITFAAVRMLARKRPIGVVRISSTAADTMPTSEAMSVADVAYRTARMEGVTGVLTIGAHECSRPGVINRESLRDGECTELVAQLPHGDLYLAIDLAVMDWDMPPSGRGFSLEDLSTLIERIADSRSIAGMDVTGLDMDAAAAPLAAVAVCHILLRAMDAATRARRQA